MAALDYIKRARHAWQEFRQPSQLDIHQDPQHPGLNEVDRRGSVYPIAPIEPSAALKEYRILVGSAYRPRAVLAKCLQSLICHISPPRQVLRSKGFHTQPPANGICLWPSSSQYGHLRGFYVEQPRSATCGADLLCGRQPFAIAR